MYKRLKFRYLTVLIKTERDDNRGCVCVRQPADLSVDTVEIGKSVFTLNQDAMGSPRGNLRTTQIVSCSGKVSFRSAANPYRKPTQVRWVSNLRQAGDSSLRNSATKTRRNLWEMPCPPSLFASQRATEGHSPFIVLIKRVVFYEAPNGARSGGGSQ